MVLAAFAGISLIVALSTTNASMSKDEISDIERDAKALELFLQDRDDYEKHCPFRTWEQPEIEIYKKTLVSHLPEGCKK